MSYIATGGGDTQLQSNGETKQSIKKLKQAVNVGESTSVSVSGPPPPWGPKQTPADNLLFPHQFVLLLIK